MRTQEPAQFFLPHTESLSSSGCSCGKWNITILHPSLGLIGSLVDGIKSKAKCWLKDSDIFPFQQELAGEGMVSRDSLLCLCPCHCSLI